MLRVRAMPIGDASASLKAASSVGWVPLNPIGAIPAVLKAALAAAYCGCPSCAAANDRYCRQRDDTDLSTWLAHALVDR